jgi:hypothetical protein
MISIDDQWKDTALAQDDPGVWAGIPSFEPDWKGKSPNSSSPEFQQPDVRRELRVRTRINPGQRRAEDNMLFAYEMVSPGDEFEWLIYIDFPDESDTAARQLQELLSNGIRAFGKTKATMSCEFLEMADPPQSIEPRDGLYVIVLQTPALLNDPMQFNNDLVADYKAAWSDLSNGSLELKHFKARQDLAGGFYQHKRFRPEQRYRPWLLTRAGSVFVLQPVEGKESLAKQIAAKWLREGLSLPSGPAAFYQLQDDSSDWESCPYIRQNGYGEVAINCSSHWEMQL